MNTFSRERWTQLWRAAGVQGDPTQWYERLATAYAEPHRDYHNQRHIAECLRQFDHVRNLCQDPLAVEFGIWFHDAIYDPKISDNEERSAELAARCLAEGQVEPAFSELVQQLVLVTKTHEPELGTDLALMVDIDLAILGSPWARFSEYEQAIRREHVWVPDEIFGPKRVAILERFLARDRIYSSEWFQQNYEHQARANLQQSIHNLKGLSR